MLIDFNTRTASTRDRQIVEMVEKALGISSNMAPSSAPVAEEEMVQKDPLPKYNSIDELMKEIESGTNKAAHEHKMNKMKEVYEALEEKVTSLEEGEHAEHIDQKAIKQMRKDIAALRKAEEKLRKEYDKKFNKKEKPVKKTEEKPVALQENTKGGFDLRKFLTENKLTAGSKLIAEMESDASDLTQDTKDKILSCLETEISGDPETTVDHMGEVLVQTLEEAGIEVPQGMFNQEMDEMLTKLNQDFHNGQIEGEQAIQKAVDIVTNPDNYKNE